MLTTLSNVPGWLVPALITAFIIVCVVMMLVILIQKPKGGGLSGAFGGAGGGGSEMAAFGAKTGDVLTWFTVVLFLCFLLLAMGLTWAIRAEVRPAAAAGQQQQTAPAPVTDDEDLRHMLGEPDEEADDADADARELADEPADATMPADDQDHEDR